MTRRMKHNLVALICFGPIAIALIPFGLLLLPYWLSDLGNRLAGNAANVHYGPGATIWDTVLPIALLLSGLAGLVGLFRVLAILNFPHRVMRRRAITLLLAACGVVSVVVFSATGGYLDPYENATAAMVYWVLPLCGTLYFLYVGRRELFGVGDSSG